MEGIQTRGPSVNFKYQIIKDSVLNFTKIKYRGYTIFWTDMEELVLITNLKYEISNDKKIRISAAAFLYKLYKIVGLCTNFSANGSST